jgi:hypothetical protein
MAERETASQRLLETAPRMTAAREQLELNGILPVGVEQQDGSDPLITARRLIDGVSGPVLLGLDDPVRPGDVLSVALPMTDEAAGAAMPIR